MSVGYLVLTGLLVVIAVPSSVLAWQGIRDRRERIEEQERHEQDRRIVNEVLRQVQSPNGKTTGTMVQETADLLRAHMKDGHGGQS